MPTCRKTIEQSSENNKTKKKENLRLETEGSPNLAAEARANGKSQPRPSISDQTRVGDAYNFTIVQSLKQSIKNVGQLSDVICCKQHPEVILIGRHRTKATCGLDNVNKKEYDVDEYSRKHSISHELGELLVAVHGDIQRTVKREETRDRLLKAAAILESSGVKKEEVASKLAHLLPFSHSYILRLLPAEFKRRKFAVSKGRPRRLQGENVYLGKRDGSEEDSVEGTTSSRFNSHNIDTPVRCQGECGQELPRWMLKEILLCSEDRKKEESIGERRARAPPARALVTSRDKELGVLHQLGGVVFVAQVWRRRMASRLSSGRRT